MNAFFAELKAIDGKEITPEAVIVHEINIFPPGAGGGGYDSVEPVTFLFFQRADGSLHTKNLDDLEIRSAMTIVKRPSIPIVGQI